MEDNRDIRDRLIRIETKLDNFGKIETQSDEAFNLSKKNEEDIKDLKEKLTKVENDITEIKEKPVKRYDSIVTYIITTIVGAIIGAIITLIKK